MVRRPDRNDCLDPVLLLGLGIDGELLAGELLEDQKVRDDLTGAGATASFAASLSMALLAAVALANAGGSASTIFIVFSAVVAAAATMLSVLLLRVSISSVEARRRVSSRKLAPVPIRVKERRRVRP